jgi:hypothetical protein
MRSYDFSQAKVMATADVIVLYKNGIDSPYCNLVDWFTWSRGQYDLDTLLSFCQRFFFTPRQNSLLSNEIKKLGGNPNVVSWQNPEFELLEPFSKERIISESKKDAKTEKRRSKIWALMYTPWKSQIGKDPYEYQTWIEKQIENNVSGIVRFKDIFLERNREAMLLYDNMFNLDANNHHVPAAAITMLRQCIERAE